MKKFEGNITEAIATAQTIAKMIVENGLTSNPRLILDHALFVVGEINSYFLESDNVIITSADMIDIEEIAKQLNPAEPAMSSLSPAVIMFWAKKIICSL